MSNGRSGGFTLIELLIVVAIIAILAAIAVPNFLEAQTRAKVSRAKNDLRSLKTALESYMVDNNSYPLTYRDSYLYNFNRTELSTDPLLLTTPIAYMTSVPKDPFSKGKDHVTNVDFGRFIMWGVNNNAYKTQGRVAGVRTYPHDRIMTFSVAPDELYQTGGYWDREGIIEAEAQAVLQNHDPSNQALLFPIRYDPTNGTVSYGDLYMYPEGGFSF